MSAGKLATLDEALPRWAVPPEALVDPGADLARALHRAFGRRAPLRLDLGFGSGQATVAWASAHPDDDVLGVEVHRAGIALLVQALEAEGPANVRIADIDAAHILNGLPAGSVEEVRVLFPDPWPKRRHVARRLVDAAFVRRAAALLAPGGRLHVATDWDDYADQARAAIDGDPRLDPVIDPDRPAGDPWRSPRPPRPVTTYEGRGLDAGRTVTDLVARKRA